MKRALVLVLAAVAGLVVGGLSMLALQAPAANLPDTPPEDVAGQDEPPVATPSASPSAPATEPADLVPRDVGSLLLAWTRGGLPDGFAEQVAGLPGVGQVTTVAGDVVDLLGSRRADGRVVDDLDDGWRVPLDVVAIDPTSYADLMPKGDREDLASLGVGEALLGATSARLRGLDVGDVLTLGGGHDLVVRGVVDDTLVGAAEVVVSRADAGRLGVDTDRFVLLTHRGDRSGLEQAIRELTDRGLRVRAPGETPYLRHGDAVLPQALVKAEFGEFAYRPVGANDAIEQDPAWVADNLATVEVPVLGRVTCHRSILEPLAAALGDLEAQGLGHLVDPAQYAGCHAARMIAPDAGLSRHAWGVAVDLNADDNPHGARSRQDRRLVETFADHGFTYGGFWLVPDAMHFEYVGDPAGSPAKVVAP